MYIQNVFKTLNFFNKTAKLELSRGESRDSILVECDWNLDNLRLIQEFIQWADYIKIYLPEYTIAPIWGSEEKTRLNKKLYSLFYRVQSHYGLEFAQTLYHIATLKD